MGAAYWQKRDAVKKHIAVNLREMLIEQYSGVPVIVLRNSIDKIRADNKAWVKQALKQFECEEFNVIWQTSFEHRLNEDGMAVVYDFTITVEGN